MNEDIKKILPNLVYCLKTGRYTDTDFNEELAQEYGTSKEVAEMAAVKCCFNCKKTDILKDLISCHDFNKIELEAMAQEGISEVSYDITDIHEFFYNNKNIPFFRYCNDYLTSWDACSLVYKNDFPPSLLAQYACVVQADNGIAEELRPAVLASIGKIQWKYDGKKLNYCAISTCITANSTRKDVRDFLKENNYDFDLAQKHFNWIRQYKYFYKKSVKEDNHIRMVRKYPVLVGIPLIVKTSGQASYFKFIDLNDGNEKGQDFNKLVKKALDIQKKAIFQYEHNMLNQSSIEILNEEIAECYDMLLYLYISGKSSIIDYNNKKWKAKYKDKITDKLNELMGEVEEMWLFKDVISTMFLSNNIEKCLYKINGWTDLLINNNDNISLSLINRRKEI